MRMKKLAAVLLALALALSLGTAALADIQTAGTVGVYLWVELTAATPGYEDEEYVVDVCLDSGTLPPGMSLGQNRDVSCVVGTPTQAGTYTFSGTTYYDVGYTVSWTATIEISAAATPTPAPKITKHPGGETVTEGSSTYFTSYGDNVTGYAWSFRDKSGNTVEYGSIGGDFPSMGVSGGSTSKLSLSNIPLGFDGWSVVCTLSGPAEA